MANDIDPIALAKVILWEQAKGALRALAVAAGSYPSNIITSTKWETVDDTIETFIRKFEDDGLHE